MAAGLKSTLAAHRLGRMLTCDSQYVAVILLAFVLAVGFLLIILSCALWHNWLPLIVGEHPVLPYTLAHTNNRLLLALLFVVAPLPNAIFSHCGADDFSTDYDGANAAVDVGRFLTAGIVVTAFALPLVLAHAEVIKPTASAMAIVGGGLVYGTILAYTAVFKADSDEF
jgi:hypothetical protein